MYWYPEPYELYLPLATSSSLPLLQWYWTLQVPPEGPPPSETGHGTFDPSHNFFPTPLLFSYYPHLPTYLGHPPLRHTELLPGGSCLPSFRFSVSHTHLGPLDGVCVVPSLETCRPSGLCRSQGLDVYLSSSRPFEGTSNSSHHFESRTI